MRQTFNKYDISIITTEAVTKTFDNKDAYLYSKIKLISDCPDLKERKYGIRTDLAIYKSESRFKLNSDGTIKVSSTGEPIYEAIEILTWAEQKSDWAVHTYTYEQINKLSKKVISKVPKGLSKTSRDMEELSLVFLHQRQLEAPWGITKDKWKISTDVDLIKDKK